jgi:hypothetical protein
MTDHSEERRGIMRVHARWQLLAKQGLPKRSDIDPKTFGDDWAHCLMIAFDAKTSQPVPLLSGSETPNVSITPKLAKTLLTLIQRHVPRVLANGKPFGYGGAASHEDKDILYRMVLLPLSDDGKQVDALLAAMTYRDIPEPSELRVSDIAWCKSPLDRLQ